MSSGNAHVEASVSALPVRVEDISAAWLSSVLDERYPGAVVRNLRQTELIQGTATKIRVHLTYNEAGRAAGLPPSLIVKGGFSAHREMMADIYELEARFYRELAPRLEIRLPRCFYSGSDPTRRQAIVLLEDLDAREAKFCRVQSPLTYEQAQAQLVALAVLHARWWEAPELHAGGQLGWVERLDPLPEGEAGRYQRGQLVPDVYAQYMALPRGAAVSRHFHDRDRMLEALERLRIIDRQGPVCVLHGDAHLGNLYFDADGAAGVLDWQAVRQGPWSHDVAYFLGSALDVPDRRAWEEPLLKFYLDQLRAHAVSPPDFADAWSGYRAQMVYGLYYWLVNPVEFQAEVNNCAVASRFAHAVLDHGTLTSFLSGGEGP
jgi:Phosphotransferase enzyme family